MIRELHDFEENYQQFFECEVCDGLGGWDIGDCEDGVWEICDICNGTGEVEYDPDNTDRFIPERDALTPND